MHGIQRYLESILSHLNRLNHSAAQLLRDGLPRQLIDQKTTSLPISLPTEVLDLYSWRDGTRIPPDCVVNDLDFFPGYYFLSLDDALSSYNAFKDDDRWNKYWFPLFANGGGDFYAAVCADEVHESGEVLCFLLGVPTDELLVEFKSLEKMLQTISACYDEGIFYAQPNGYLDADDDRYVTLVRTLNPHLASCDNL